MTGIYKIESIINPKKIYIGSAINITKRKREHLFQLKNKSHHNPKLQAHFNKYGIEDLRFSILITCEKEDLIKHEQFFIDSYKPWFNCSPTAGNMLGIKRSPEACRNIGKSKIGHIPWNKGIKLSKEHCDNLHKSHIGQIAWNKGLIGFGKGKKMTAEQNKKNSISKQGSKNPMFGKTSSRKGKKLSPHTEETKHKMSVSQIKRWQELKLKTA